MEPLPDDLEEVNEDKPGRWSGLGVRTLSALVLGIIAFVCIGVGGLAFTAFILLVALVTKKEWDALITRQSIVLRASGYVYVILPCASLIWLRDLPDHTGLAATVALIAIVSATDIGAYAFGRRFGRHKLAPAISPGKTWEGLAGGATAAFVAALFVLRAVPLPHPLPSALWFGPLLAVVAQIGDLFESAIKRQAGVKDSGTLLPGHGGLLDRFDGYMFAAPIYALFVHSALASAAG